MDPGPVLQVAFARWYEHHYQAVFAYACRRVPEDAARDVAAEVFLVAWRRWDVAEAGGLPWLYTTAHHTVSVWRRSQRRSGALVARVAAQPPSSDAGDPALEHAEREAVLSVVRQLPVLDRELLLLTVWEQLDVTTAAGVAGCSVGAAHVRLHRARRRLRLLLAARGLGPPHRPAAAQDTSGHACGAPPLAPPGTCPTSAPPVAQEATP